MDSKTVLTVGRLRNALTGIPDGMEVKLIGSVEDQNKGKIVIEDAYHVHVIPENKDLEENSASTDYFAIYANEEK